MVLAMAASSGGVFGGASLGGASDSALARSVQARTVKGTKAAKRGNYTKTWSSMRLRSLRNRIEHQVECASHSYGQVQKFFTQTPCRFLSRRLFALVDEQGNSFQLSISWVRMSSYGNAARLRRLADSDGTGNIYALGHQQFSGEHYDSRLSKTTVVIAEAEPLTDEPSSELMDGAATVATYFPRS